MLHYYVINQRVFFCLEREGGGNGGIVEEILLKLFVLEGIEYYMTYDK